MGVKLDASQHEHFVKSDISRVAEAQPRLKKKSLTQQDNESFVAKTGIDLIFILSADTCGSFNQNYLSKQEDDTPVNCALCALIPALGQMNPFFFFPE